MKVGLVLPHWSGSMAGATPRWADVRALASQAEAIGFDSLWLVDSLHLRLGQEPLGFWECWSLLAALAASTKRVELGTLVVSNNFRNPALLAKMADTLDEVSGGRLILGIGAGDVEEQSRAFGLAWEHRFERFEEALIILTNLLRERRVDFAGRHYQVRDCELLPRAPDAERTTYSRGRQPAHRAAHASIGGAIGRHVECLAGVWPQRSG